VIARNSTFQYKGKAVDVRTLGRDLGARYVVEGSVRKSGSRIRVTSQLIDTDDGKHLWAETYDGDMTANDIFEVQDEISGKIVATVVGPHGVISRTRLGQRSGSRSLDSYECVLLAMAFKSDMSPDSHLRSRECLEQAVEQDPEFADAWAWLADILVDEYSVGFNPLPGDPLERAFQAAHKAIALDANNQRAHLALAGTLFYRQDPALFEKAELALALNPNDTEALARMGLYITMAGHGAERGVELLRKAMALNPAHPRFLYFPIGNYYYFKREYEEALSWGLRTEMPGFYWYHADLARVYAQLGRLEEARAHVEELNRLAPDFSKNVWREFRKWNWEESAVLHLIDGMRKAGLEIPPDD
jgi:adenylate cyclase